MPSPGAQRGDIDIGRGGIRGDIERDDLSAQIGDEDDFSEDIADSLGLGTVSDQDIAAALGGIASGRNFAGDPVGRSSGPAPGGIGSGNRPGSGYGNDWGRSRTDQGIAGGRLDREGEGYYGGGLLDVGGRLDREGEGYYDSGLLDSGLLDSGVNFYDEDEDYQGQMMDQYTEDYEGNYDARTPGRKIGDWWNKNNPIINALRSLGFDANLDQTLGTGHDVGGGGEESRDDQVAENACAAAGGTWDGGTCVMPSDGNGDDGNGDDDGGGDIDYGAFGKPNPFASLTRKRQMWYHPMLGGTGHGQVYDPYSGERPSHVDANLWDYAAPRGGAELKNWASDLRKWASGE